MFVRSLHNIALLVVLGGLAGCSGGGSQIGAASFSCTGSAPRAMCLQNCNLGCSTTGCSRSDIAQNEIIILQFSAQVDPKTVGPSSIRFRTASGDQPIGEFFVNGNQVEFVPSLAITGGQTFYGFTSGETYTMTVIGGEDQPAVVRSTGGQAFEKTLTCTLHSTRGIVDLNGVPPRATIVAPTVEQASAVPLDSDFVLEFNELIDATPFISGTQSPVTFSVRRTRVAAAGGSECDPNSAPQVLNGTQRLSFDAGGGTSLLTFHPSQKLPGNVCVEVNVTNGVTDLSGRSAQPQTFSFRTALVVQIESQIVEEFDVPNQLDLDASGADWAGGVVVFSQVGGDGRHGDFSTSLCFDTTLTVGGKRVYELNCDGTTIPATNTTTGSAIVISDGKFFFSTMVVPADVRLVFTGAGSNPPVITVAGRCDIQGELVVSGTSISSPPPYSTAASVPAPGQPGAAGGIFGGSGGKGGDRIVPTAPGAQPVNQGQTGDAARLLAGHAYFGTQAGSGGPGSTVQPPSGNFVDLQYGVGVTASSFTWPCLSASAGGGGGGLFAAGSPARVTPDAVTGLSFVGHIWNSHVATVANGTPTAISASSLTDATANWLPNAFAGATVGSSGNTGIVLSNTANTLTLAGSWTPATPPLPLQTLTYGIIMPGAVQPRPSVMGPIAGAGSALTLFPFPAGSGFTRSSQHFLVGGSGGGGAAASPCLTLFLNSSRAYAPGCGGGGGGGAMAVRAGGSLRIAPTGKLLAAGGNAANNTGSPTTSPQSSPGGGGSGGSILMQAGRTFDIAGLVDVRGGLGGQFDRQASSAVQPAGGRFKIAGGNGSPGYARLEAPTVPTLAQLVTLQPAATTQNVGVLAEVDDLAVCRSKYYSTQLIFGPDFSHYEIYATVGGVPVVLSDNPAVSTTPAQVGAPIRALFQCARLDLGTNAPLEVGPWRTSVRSSATQIGIASDAFNGFRFMLVLDRAVASNVVIQKIVVVYRV